LGETGRITQEEEKKRRYKPGKRRRNGGINPDNTGETGRITRVIQ